MIRSSVDHIRPVTQAADDVAQAIRREATPWITTVGTEPVMAAPVNELFRELCAAGLAHRRREQFVVRVRFDLPRVVSI